MVLTWLDKQVYVCVCVCVCVLMRCLFNLICNSSGIDNRVLANRWRQSERTRATRLVTRARFSSIAPA